MERAKEIRSRDPQGELGEVMWLLMSEGHFSCFALDKS